MLIVLSFSQSSSSVRTTTQSAVKMSTGDVVCTGWLIKSPPEKKLKRFTWRKRWFVLRRGRMSGNPDVLEYYQCKTSKKPIRTIDLKECKVQVQTGQLLLKRAFHQKYPFVVKTSTRIFYLLAKTEEEMKIWIERISQICQFGSLTDAAEESSDEGFPHTPTPNQRTPSTHPASDCDRSSMLSLDPLSHPLDYLFLSQCETGQSVCISRCESFSTSDSCLERTFSDADDIIASPIASPTVANISPASLSHSEHCASLFAHGRMFKPPISAPCTSVAFDRSGQSRSSSSSSLPQDSSTASVFQFDEPFPSSLCTNQHTAPPLPPKPNNFSEKLADQRVHGSLLWNDSHPIPRRTSFAGLDHFKTGNKDSIPLRNKRLSLNLHFCSPQVTNSQTDPYVPMASQTFSVTSDPSEGYIPMNPRTKNFHESVCAIEAHNPRSPNRSDLDELLPPPINRHLKPCRRARPPPLDLRGLSTITELSTQPSSMTESSDTLNGFLIERRLENGGTNQDKDNNCIAMEAKFLPVPDTALQSWTRRSNLDYLSLDFNSASPSPVQKKAFLADEHRVDYVQVDETKTQALQSTRMEWTDVRQSKT